MMDTIGGPKAPDHDSVVDFNLKPFVGICGSPGVNLLDLPVGQTRAPSGEEPSDAARWTRLPGHEPRYEDGGAMRFGHGS